MSHHIYGKFCQYTFMERKCVWLTISLLAQVLCLIRCNEMWHCLVCKIYCKTNCKPGGTLGVHRRNPSEGSAVSARPAKGFAINTKPQVWFLANHSTSYFHTHSFILSSNPLTSHFICEVSFCSKEVHEFIKSYKYSTQRCKTC